MMKRRWLKVSLGLIAILLAFLCWTAWMIWSYRGEPVPPHTDAAIVLGAAAWGDEPSPVFRERINHAIDLYRHRYVRKIIFTGGKGKTSGHAESEVARRYAVGQGVPQADILTEDVSHITEENLRNARELARRQDLRSFLIVSDPLHMKRSMLMTRDLGMDACPSPTPTTLYKSRDSKLRFLAREVLFYVIYLVTRHFADG